MNNSVSHEIAPSPASDSIADHEAPRANDGILEHLLSVPPLEEAAESAPVGDESPRGIIDV